MNIGDLFFGLRADDARLRQDVAKQGDKAGKTLGEHVNRSLTETLKQGVAWGAGFDVGRRAMHALTDAIGDVATAIPDAIKSGQDFALTVDDISDKTGASAETASRFAGTLQYLGIQTSGLGSSLRVLSTEIVANESKFTKLGIATRDSNGDLLDTITILGNVRTYLSGAGDGATKMALAADLLGRSSGELIDFLNLTDAEALALAQTMDELGVTISESTRKDMEQLQRETNLLGLAWQGLSNTLASEAAPTIRQVIGGLTTFIKENGAAIRQTFLDITNAVLGFVSGLVDASGFTPFQMQLDSIADGGDRITLSKEQWAQQTGRLIPKVEKLTGATSDGTKAIDKQTKAIDRQIDSERDRADAELAVVDAQIKQLDMAEQQIAIDERKRDLNEQLNDAQLALTEAMGGQDAEAISDAMAQVADIQEAQAKNEHDLGVDAQRDKLQMQRDEIEAKSQAKQDELQGLKDQLQEQRTAISAAGSAQVSDNKKKLADFDADYQAYVDAQVAETQLSSDTMQRLIRGDPATGTGIGGAITKAFTDGKAAGEGFRDFLTNDLVPAVQGVLGFFMKIKETIDEIANSDVWKTLNEPVDPFTGPNKNPMIEGIRNALPRRNPLIEGIRNPVPSELGFSPSSLSGMSGFGGGVPLNVTVVSVLDGREVARSTGRVFADELRH